jgi:hypothetical protein
MPTRFPACLLAALLVVVLAIACGDEPTSRVPTQPSDPFIRGVELVGPDTVAPGQSAQFGIRIRLSDNTVKAPASVRWLSTGTVLTVDDSGLATARPQLGEDVLTAEVTTDGLIRRLTREVLVLAPGTFRLTGVIRDEELPEVLVVGARVEAIPGPTVATTDTEGRFRLYGIAGQVNLLITAVGYAPLARSLQVNTHANQNFQLALSGPRSTLQGNYTVGFEAISCSGLDSNFLVRSYEAAVTQSGADLTVTLTEPRFRVDGAGKGNRFRGRAMSGGAAFTLDPFVTEYYNNGLIAYPDVAEQLSDGSVLVTAGSVVLLGSATAMSGEMSSDSTMQRWDSRFPAVERFLGGCFSQSRIRFTLTAR